MINLYSILHLNADATKEQISEAYHLRKHMTNDRNTLWLIEEAHTLLMNDENRIKYDALIFKDELAKEEDVKTSDSVKVNKHEKLPKLLSYIVWLFSFDCGRIIIHNLKNILIFSTSMNNGVFVLSSFIGGLFGLTVTLIPVILGILAIGKRFKIAIKALMIVAVLHFAMNIVSFLTFWQLAGDLYETIYQLITIGLLILAIILLIKASSDQSVQAWLNIRKTNCKAYIFIYIICSVLSVMISVASYYVGVLGAKKLATQGRLLSDSEMKYLGTSGKYYYYLNLSTKITTTSHGYVIPLVITDVEDNQSQHQTNVVIDSNMQKFCMEDGRKDCNNSDSFQHYELTSPIGEAVQFIERSNESN